MLALSSCSSATQWGVTELPCRDLWILEGQGIYCNRLDLSHSSFFRWNEKSEAPQMRKVTFIKCLVNHRDHPQIGVRSGFPGCFVNKLVRLIFISPGQLSICRLRLYKAQVANTRPTGQIRPYTLFYSPGTLFLPGGSAKLLAPS